MSPEALAAMLRRGGHGADLLAPKPEEPPGRFAVYDPASGRIRAVYAPTRALAEANAAPGEAVERVPHEVRPATHHMTAEGPVARPGGVVVPSPVRAGEPVTLDLPAGAVVHLNGELAGTADGEPVEIVFAHPGRHMVAIDAHPAAHVLAVVEVL